MKRVVLALALAILAGGSSYAEDDEGRSRAIAMSTDAGGSVPGQNVQFECTGTGRWRLPLRYARITIFDARTNTVVNLADMAVDGLNASYGYQIPADGVAGQWRYRCELRDRYGRETNYARFTVNDGPVVEPPPTEPPPTEPPPTEPPPTEPPPTEPPPTEPPPVVLVDGPIAAHNTITSYNGPATCIECHQTEATDMVNSLHMQWSGPTPKLTNNDGQPKGKGAGGINTFCTYAMSSKGACYSCHVRADGNAPHPPQPADVDCLMCHSDTYQRKFVADPNNTETVVNVLGQEKTYVFGKVDAQGNYLTVPDYDAMPPGTSIVNVARTVTMPTKQSCLRCHAKAGGGDWVKRGDLGMNSAEATVDQDVHLAKDGADLGCINCHSALNHKISGRGIDLRATEAAAPTCQACHSTAPHSNATLNRHAQGQVSCQVCHIREFGKGGATEMSRDWSRPNWNSAFCSGQGGFVGEEVKQGNVKPEYVWFDGTSYVYNVGETISPDPQTGVYHMAKANGAPFDGKSKIVPIKRHFSTMPLAENGQIIPPAIMWMFMTGDFDLAVQKGMEEQGMTGSYSIVPTDAEMLITHGVDPKAKAPACAECHASTGLTPDGTGLVPFASLGYHQMPTAVKSCTLCHSQRSASWQSMHQDHRADGIGCTSCHTTNPTGLVKPQTTLCSSCHERESWSNSRHSTHIRRRIQCTSCHTF